MVWMRAVPSTCRTAGMQPALSGTTSWTKSMNGEDWAPANQRAASSSRTTGATGRKSSRSLISLSRACIVAGMGEGRIERAECPRAEFHAPLEPADDYVLRQDAGGLVRHTDRAAAVRQPGPA